MSKRSADHQINHLEDEHENDRDTSDPAKVADKAVLASRKIAKPRARRAGTTTSSLPLPSPVSSFGSVADTSISSANPFAGVAFPTSSFGAKPSTITASKPANPFSGITSTTGPATSTPAFSFKAADASSATTPSFSFKPQQTATPVASTFSFKPAEPASTPSSFSFKPAGATSTPSTTFNFKPAESKPEPAAAFSFKPADTKPASQPAAFSFKSTDAASTTTPPALFKPAAPVTSTFGLPASKPDSSEDDKKLKFRALNEKFSAAFTEQLKNNIYGDLSVVLQAYLTFAKDIKSSTTTAVKTSTPAPTAPAKAPEPESSEDEEEEEKKSTEITGPQFVMKEVPKSKSKGPFLFGKEAEARAKRLAAENSDSEDEVEIKGPQFTMNVVPTTSSNIFSFKPAAPKEDNEKKDTPAAAPSFNFSEATPAAAAPAPAAAPSTPFKFGASNGTSAVSDNNHTWTPDKGIKFSTSSSNTSTSSTTDSAPKPTFSFGAAAPAPAADKKPMFSFGASAPAAATTGDSAKPVPFKFGSATPATGPGLFGASTGSTASKPFSFGAQAATTGTSTENAVPKPFSFGAAPGAAPAAPATGFKFSFGGDNKAAPSGPSLFGTPTTIAPTGPSLFGSSASATTTTAPQNTVAPASAPADDDGEPPADPQAADLTGKGPGEESEDSMYEKKARVYEIKDGKPEVLGLGLLRVLTHNETKKTRVLVRAEGSGRVIINVLLRDKLKYTAAGNQVKIMDFKADGSPTTYLVRVKTADDGAELSRVMEQQKVLGA